ncbi:hypothetical protein V490_05152 [Pseudogymnoascus sp. VKM F-3557]|nr:hypothetical protein V490_05152 [Pseudogymnoascus sp. VKM F-3557]
MGIATDAKIGFSQDNEESPLLFPTPPQATAIYGSSSGTDTEGDAENAADEYSPKATKRSITVIITALLIGVFISNADGSLLLATNGWIASEFNDLENASCIFGIGCAICALGQSLPAVVAGRVISGVGGAGMDSLVNILITDLVPPRDVGSWRSYVNLVATTGRSLGGPVGGYLADTIGWRWSFLGQCPLTLLAIISTYLLVPKQTAPQKGGVKEGSKLARIDFAGAFLLAATILLFLLPLEITGVKIPWTHPLVLVLFASSITTGVFFVTGRYKILLSAASISASLSYLLLCLRWHGHTNWLESLYVVPGGFGNGMLNSAAFVALTATIDRSQVAMAASTFFLSANGGMAVGMASASAVIQSSLRSGLEAKLGDIPNRALVIKNSMSNIDYIQSLEGDVKKVVVGVYTDSLQKSHYLNLGFAMSGFFQPQ